jgi:hypothetical protein
MGERLRSNIVIVVATCLIMFILLLVFILSQNKAIASELNKKAYKTYVDGILIKQNDSIMKILNKNTELLKKLPIR